MLLFAIALIFGGLLALWITVLIQERRSGVRTMGRIRGALDRTYLRYRDRVVRETPTINREYLRHLFHYGIHGLLSTLLALVGKVERLLRATVRSNRKRALMPGGARPHSYLGQVLEHKEASALTDAEKEAHKEKALKGQSMPPASNELPQG